MDLSFNIRTNLHFVNGVFPRFWCVIESISNLNIKKRKVIMLKLKWSVNIISTNKDIPVGKTDLTFSYLKI